MWNFSLVKYPDVQQFLKVYTGHQLASLQHCMMSVIHKLAGRLFHRAGPCLGDIGNGEGRHDRPQEELEACNWSEFLFWSWAVAWVRGGAVAHAMSL